MFPGDSLTPLESETSSNINTGSSMSAIQIGQVLSGSTPVGASIYLDDMAFSTTGWLSRAE